MALLLQRVQLYYSQVIQVTYGGGRGDRGVWSPLQRLLVSTED